MSGYSNSFATFALHLVLMGSVSAVICQVPVEAAGYLEDDIAGISPYFFQGKSGLKDERYRWPNATVPYQFEADYPTESQLRFQQATEYISSLTCVRFVPRTTQKDYIKVISGGGCYSFVGRMGEGQVVSLPLPCTSFGVIVHELIHSIGYFHEQSRSDRDKFVVIHWENIIPGKEGNFKRYDETVVDSFGVDYDHGSIMHYPSNAFSVNGKDTITTIPPGIAVGNLKGMSPKDVLKVNRMYKCNE